MEKTADIKNIREKQRVNFILNDNEYRTIKNIQSATNMNISDIVRNALRIYEWLKDTEDMDKNKLTDLIKDSINVYSWARKLANQNNLDLSPSEFIRNSVKVFLWAKERTQNGSSQLDPKEIQILF